MKKIIVFRFVSLSNKCGVPVGICGSGILDVVAHFSLAGVLDNCGRMGNHVRASVREGKREFILVREAELDGHAAITITQKDVREIQLAKGGHTHRYPGAPGGEGPI